MVTPHGNMNSWLKSTAMEIGVDATDDAKPSKTAEMKLKML